MPGVERDHDATVPVVTDCTPNKSARRTNGAAIALAMLLWALVIYRPWMTLPFDRTDFPQLLGLLRAQHSLLSGFAELERYCRSEGRYIPVAMFAFALKWSAFGWNSVAWQLGNFVPMLAAVALTFALFRRLGASVSGSVAGAAVLIVGCSGSAVWWQLQLAEPLGIPCVLGAALIAARYRDRGSRLHDAFAAAALLALAILAKEMFAACVPFVLLIGACFEKGRWRTPSIDRSAIRLTIVIGAATLAALAPVLAVRMEANERSYAARYSAQSISLEKAVVLVHTMFFPASDSLSRPFPDVAFVAVLLLGWIAARRLGVMREMWLVALAALSLPVLGTLAYLPWPVHPERYAAPFSLGPAMLLAFAVTFIERDGSRQPKRLAVSLLALLATFGTLRARAEMDGDREARRSDARFVMTLHARATNTNARELLAISGRICPWCWLMTIYIDALPTTPLPRLRVVTCDAARAALVERRDAIVLARPEDCAAIGPPNDTIVWRDRSVFVAHPAPPPDGVSDALGIWLGR